MVKDWAGDADREEDGVCEEAGVVLNSLNVAGHIGTYKKFSLIILC